MQMMPENQETPLSKEKQMIEPYQFKYYSRSSRAILKLIQKIHQDLAKKLTKSLSSFLTSEITVELEDIQRKGLKKYLLSLNDPTFIASLDNASIDSFGLIEINSLLVYSAINKMLGGRNEMELFSSHLEKLEKAFIRKLFNHILNELNIAWQPVQTLGLTIRDIHSHPNQTHSRETVEIFIVSNFRIKMGNFQGFMSIALPYLMFHSISALKDLKDTSPPSQKQIDLNDIKIELQAILGKLQLSLSELKSLRRGDVLDLGNDITEVTLRIAGEPKFKAAPGLVKQAKGIILRKTISTQEKNRWTT